MADKLFGLAGIGGVTFVAALFGSRMFASEGVSDERADIVLFVVVALPLLVAHAVAGLAAARQRSIAPLTRVWRGMLWGVVAGALLGLGLRIGMRVVAVLAGVPPQFSLGGTLAVLLMGVVLGTSYGGLYATVRRLFPTSYAGAAFGVVIAGLFWPGFLRVATGDLDGHVSEATIVILTASLSSLWVAYGGTLAWLTGRSGRDR